jgi:hypothetical protein
MSKTQEDGELCNRQEKVDLLQVNQTDHQLQQADKSQIKAEASQEDVELIYLPQSAHKT